MVDPALSAAEPANKVHSASGSLKGGLSCGRIPVLLLVVFCVVLAAPLATALPAPAEDGGILVDENGSSEKPVTAKVPSIAGTTPEPAEKPVTERPVTFAITPAETEPTVVETEPTMEATETPAPPATSGSSPNDTDGTGPGENVTTMDTVSLTATASPEPTLTVTATEEGVEEEEEEEDPSPIPTLEREAPPRPNATMARAHQYYDRELPLGGHQLISPVSTYTPAEDEPEAPPSVAVPRDGLIVRGVGTLLDRTPEDVVLTRSGVEIANLDWLLDTAMILGGRHPRAVFEGETFTVTVTVEARNITLSEGDEAYVVLVPPPGETGVYEITRLGGPRSLRDGERGVWEFSVVTRTGRLALADLTLPEERLVTNLSAKPDLFAFRAYAFIDGQEIPSTALSDPVLSIRPDGAAVPAESRSLPEIYAAAGIEDSMLDPSETMTGAWQRGIGYEAIVAGAVEHQDAIQALGLEKLAAIQTLEEGEGGENPGDSSSSPFDWIARFFGGLFGWTGA